MGRKLAIGAMVLAGIVVALVLAFYGYFGYQGWTLREQARSEAAQIKSLFLHDDGRYLYVNVDSAPLRKAPAMAGELVDTLAFGAALYNFQGAQAPLKDGYLFVSVAPDSDAGSGWIKVSEIAGQFPSLEELAKQFQSDKDADRRLELAERMARLEPGNPDAWKPLILVAKQRNDRALAKRALDGQREGNVAVVMMVGPAGSWGLVQGRKLASEQPVIGSRVATLEATPRAYRFQGGNSCHIHALGAGDERRPGVVELATNRPAAVRKLGMQKLAAADAGKYREQLLVFLAGSEEVPENIREEVLDQLLHAVYRAAGSPYVLVSDTVKVPSEGDQAYFRAHLLLDTAAPAAGFVPILADWTRDAELPALAFSFGEKSPALTFMLRMSEEGEYVYQFYQFDPAKKAWLMAMEAHVPDC